MSGILVNTNFNKLTGEVEKVLKAEVITTYWASEANPTLGYSIEILRDVYVLVGRYVCRMSN